MATIYVIRGSEDGNIAATVSAKRALSIAVQYVMQRGQRASYHGQTIEHVDSPVAVQAIRDLRKGYYLIIETIGDHATAEIERFED